MSKLFSSILVPIDLSGNSTLPLGKAIDFATEYSCNIHLLTVNPISPLLSVFEPANELAYEEEFNNKQELNYNLQKIAENIRRMSGNKIEAEATVLQGNRDEVVVSFVRQNKIDLILIGQKGNQLTRRKMKFHPNRIAARTGIPVVTIPANRRITRLLSLVIPVASGFPLRKIQYAICLASKFKTRIQLLGIKNASTEKHLGYFIDEAIRYIKRNSDSLVEWEIVNNGNIAQAVNQFAMLKSTDLIIVNPGTETNMHGYFSGMIGDVIQKFSAPPVMTITPFSQIHYS